MPSTYGITKKKIKVLTKVLSSITILDADRFFGDPGMFLLMSLTSSSPPNISHLILDDF